MGETLMIVRKKVEGEVEYNDGEFAEIQTKGIEGIIEEGLLLDTIQIRREESSYTRQRFGVGTRLEILTTTEIETAGG
jgi:hypothetical protein